MYIAAGVASLISLPMEYFLFGLAGGKLVERIRSLSFERVVHQEISWFDNPSNARRASKYPSTLLYLYSRFFCKILTFALHFIYCGNCFPVEQLALDCLLMLQIFDGL
jgi:hypothetical protein